MDDKQLLDLRKILNCEILKVYSTYLSDNNIKSITVEEKYLEYLERNDLLTNYDNIVRQLEFYYSNQFYDKIEKLILMINIDKDFITDENRYDITYITEINNTLKLIKENYQIVSNDKKLFSKNVKELEEKIQKEKSIINDLIKNTSNKLELIPIMGRKLIENKADDEEPKTKTEKERRELFVKITSNAVFLKKFKELLQNRYDKLNEINRTKLEKFIELINNDNDEYEKHRNESKRIIELAELLIETLKHLIIILGIFRDINNSEIKDFIIDIMIESFANFENGVGTIITDDHETKIQKFFLKQIKEKFDESYYEKYFEEISRKNRPDSTERLKEAIEELLSNANSNIANKRIIERKLNKIRDIIQKLYYTDSDELKRENEEYKNNKKEKLEEIKKILERIPKLQLTPNIRKKDILGKVIDIKFDEGDFEAGYLNYSCKNDNIKYKKFINKIKNKLLKSNIKEGFKDKLKTNYENLKIKYGLIFNRDNPLEDKHIESVKNYVGNSITSLFVRYMLFGGDMKFIDTKDYFVINYTLNKDATDNFIQERQDGIDVGGLRRDFITSLTTELFEKKIFITSDGTFKYSLNPEFEPDEFMKYIIKFELRLDDNYFQTKFIIDFYKFLGQLILFVLVNDCGLDKHLSSYLLASFCSFNERINDYDYISFMINDFPEEFKHLCFLLENPRTVKDVLGFNFNDFYLLNDVEIDDCDCSLDIEELDKKNKQCKLFCITSDNIDTYIKKIAKFMMTKTILRKNIEISPDKDYKKICERGQRITSLFISGIPKDIILDLKRNNFCPWVINSYLKNPDMSIEIINKLTLNFTTTMNSEPNYQSNKDLEKLTVIFNLYVLRNLKGFHRDKESYYKFLIDLLKFWSGSSFYKDNQKYKIQIDPNLSEDHLPHSHTCFFTIDLPKYRGNNYDEIGRKMFDKVNMAISNVEAGIGYAGGRRSSKK